MSEIERMSESADHYENRRKMKKSMGRGDWWVAIGIYLILSGIAVVIL